MSIKNSYPRAVIFGCSGTSLLDEEWSFFNQVNPLGFILFARNIESPSQVKDLVSDLRSSVGRADAPILIDQEGGRVQRLRPPFWREAPPASFFAQLAKQDLKQACLEIRENNYLIAQELACLGINVNCTPVLDLPVTGAHDIIGDRALGENPETIIALGKEVINGMLDHDVIPILKHIPGHGRALSDSHHELPIVTTSRDELEKSDFLPFKALKDAPWAMTAHIIYQAIDPDHPATTSKKVIEEIVRGLIGFQNLLISDDLSMKALTGTFKERTKQALQAGCDVVLHCNGIWEEMQEIASVCPIMIEESWQRYQKSSMRMSIQSGG